MTVPFSLSLLLKEIKFSLFVSCFIFYFLVVRRRFPLREKSFAECHMICKTLWNRKIYENRRFLKIIKIQAS